MLIMLLTNSVGCVVVNDKWHGRTLNACSWGYVYCNTIALGLLCSSQIDNQHTIMDHET